MAKKVYVKKRKPVEEKRILEIEKEILNNQTKLDLEK